MVRKTLALLATGLILFAALLIQMSAVQAAAPKQTEPDPALEEPLPQPLRIRINQSIPLTLNLPAALLDGAPLTRPLITATGALTGAPLGQLPDRRETLTGTSNLTNANNITASAALTEAANDLNATGTSLGNALANAIANATEALTDSETLATETLARETLATETLATETLTGTDELAADDVLTTPALLVGVPVTLELSLDLVVTNTLTSTVPSSITLQLADRTTRTLPISISVAALPDGEVFVELLPVEETAQETIEPTPTATEEITATPEVTATTAVTPEVTVTPTVEVTAPVQTPSGLPVVATTATTTANLRAGPSTTTFDIVGQVVAGEALAVVALSEDGQWYLLDGGAWIATFLTADPAIPNLPLATQELIDQASGVAPVPTATATPVLTATVEATPVPAATTAVPPTTTSDANLRAGPGTEFPILGGTVVGQQLNIMGRNAEATWWRLDNAGWVFGELIANLPAPETVPVVAADGTVIEAAATPTPVPGAGLLLPTPTPAAAANTTAATATPASRPDANYISAVQGIVDTYDGIVQTLDSLIADARRDSAVLTNPDWANRVNATLVLLRRTAASVGELVPPADRTVAQDNLVAAAREYTNAGNALSQAASTAAVAQLDVAETAIQAANASLAGVENALR